MAHLQREYPLFSACGLNCGLCPRHHTAGTSQCPGCGGEGFAAKHPPCGVLSCTRRKGLAYCGLCEDFPCAKYNGAADFDSFITHRHQLLDIEKAQKIGLAAYRQELDEKVAVLTYLLANYDDGRHKSFFCTAVNLLPLADVRQVQLQITAATAPEQAPKEKAAMAQRLFEAIAHERGIPLKLRKKTRLQKP